MIYLNEQQLEIATIDYFRELGHGYTFGPDIAFDRPRPERDPGASHSNVVLTRRPCLPDVEKILEEL